jgi:hypothetical protein
MTLKEAKGCVVQWRKTDDVDHPWEATVEGRLWRLRLGDYPAEDLFTLIIDGRELGTLNDVPPEWKLGQDDRKVTP